MKVRDDIFALLGIKLEIVRTTKVANPFVHHPLVTPGLAVGQRVISITAGGDEQIWVIGETKPGQAFVDRVPAETFV